MSLKNVPKDESRCALVFADSGLPRRFCIFSSTCVHSPIVMRQTAATHSAAISRVQRSGVTHSGCTLATQRPALRRYTKMRLRLLGCKVEVSRHRSAKCTHLAGTPLRESPKCDLAVGLDNGCAMMPKPASARDTTPILARLYGIRVSARSVSSTSSVTSSRRGLFAASKRVQTAHCASLAPYRL